MKLIERIRIPIVIVEAREIRQLILSDSTERFISSNEYVSLLSEYNGGRMDVTESP